MAVQGKEAVGADQVSVVADTSYSNGEHGARCEKDGITAIVPRPETINPRGEHISAATSLATMRKTTAGVARPAKR